VGNRVVKFWEKKTVFKSVVLSIGLQTTFATVESSFPLFICSTIHSIPSYE
jgi:hypothetical protein